LDEQPPIRDTADANLQFDKAEYVAPDRGDSVCGACRSNLTGAYYDVNGSVLCEDCHEALQVRLTGGSPTRRTLKAFVFGLGAAALGAGIYFAVLALTGYQLGLVAIIVGLMVGGAVRKGCESRGGWFYQLMAMFLTYCAIVVTYMPMVVKGLGQAAKEKAAAENDIPKGVEKEADRGQAGEHKARDQQAKEPDQRPFHPGRFMLGLVVLFIVSFLVPFLSLASGNFMGLIIIGIALYEAWKINQRPRLVITGPYLLVQPGPRAAPSPENLNPRDANTNG
jgi:hypothetical protein